MNNKCRFMFITAATVLFASAAGLSQQETYNLTGRYAEGARWLVDTAMKTELDFNITDIEGIPSTKNTISTYEERFYEDFSDVKDGDYRIKVNFLIAENTESARGMAEKTYADENLQNKQFTISLDNNRKTYTTEGGAVSGTAQSRLACVNEFTKLLPSAPVKMNESWNVKPEEISGLMLKGKNASFTKDSFVKCSLKEVALTNGVKQAKIAVNAKLSGSLDYTTDEDNNNTNGFKMDITLKGELIMDMDSTVPVSLSLNGDISIKGVENDPVKKELVGAITATGKISCTTKYTTRVTDEEEKK
ncbi:MAG: hypothetical protein HZA48_08090 [Planctomycetes bacterium]|nr:hypothetical protein [Planctomycetota bacterium]